ncbi:MAG: alternative ribosome rescue aminoacyl-tRNA hydrolase ArfB [Bacteroidota bacterium]
MNHFQTNITTEVLAKEVTFTMSTSSGNGGQNVNRVATKATLHFSIAESSLFDEIQKAILKQNLAHRLTKDGNLVLKCQDSRSAEKNKATALKKLVDLLTSALKPAKKRKKVGVPKANRAKRLSDKKHHSEKKELRRRIIL